MERIGLEGRLVSRSTAIVGVLFFTDRNQTVLVGGRASQPTVLKYGVPHGPALGPVLFTIDITTLGHVIRHHHTVYHLFAEDTQPHKSSSPEHFVKLLPDIQSCPESVRDRMACNRLKMNDDKTDIMPAEICCTNIFSDPADSTIHGSACQPVDLSL